MPASTTSSTTAVVALSTPAALYLRLSQLGFSMSQALRLRKLADMMHGTTSLSQHPIWLLGTYYGLWDQSSDTKTLDQESLEAMLADFRSRLWFTYRRDFPALGPSMITSDVGWGCTIRSGQMLLAEALVRVTIGRSWLRTPETLPDMQAYVDLFYDQPDAPMSIHSICLAGTAAGIVPGRWVGPWMLCKGLEALFEQLGEQHRPMGLQLHVACGSGGGAPELDTAALRAMAASTPSQNGYSWPPGCAAVHVNGHGRGSTGASPRAAGAAACGQQGPAAAASVAEAGVQGGCQQGEGAGSGTAPEAAEGRGQGQQGPGGEGGCSQFNREGDVASRGPCGQQGDGGAGSGDGGGTGGGQVASGCGAGAGSKGQAEDGGPQSEGAIPGASSSGNGHGSAAAGPSGRRRGGGGSPLLLLVPLTLGMDKVNPLYLPQLAAVLSWPQSVGIVGGRPGASLYVCGVQEASSPSPPPSASSPAPSAPSSASPVPSPSFLYLDPHEAQAASRSALGSYFCDVVRVLPGASLDPSMAIGFVCSGPGDLEDLLQRLERLAREHCAAPLMTLAAAGAAGREGEGAAGGGWVARRRRGPSGAGVLDEDYTAEGLGEGGGGGQLGEDWELV